MGSYYNDLVDRGLISEPVWSWVQVLGLSFMTVLIGHLEVFSGTAALKLGIATFSLILHSMFSSALFERVQSRQGLFGYRVDNPQLRSLVQLLMTPVDMFLWLVMDLPL